MSMHEKLAETTEDDGHLVRFDYLELVVEKIGTLARGPKGRPGREVDDKAHGGDEAWILTGGRPDGRRAFTRQRQRQRRVGHLRERPRVVHFAGKIFFERSGSGHLCSPAIVLAAVGGDAGLIRTESAASLALRILSRSARNLTINSSSGTPIRLVPSVASTSGPACFGIRELGWSLGQPLQ